VLIYCIFPETLAVDEASCWGGLGQARPEQYRKYGREDSTRPHVLGRQFLLIAHSTNPSHAAVQQKSMLVDVCTRLG
jgi:hypothetical protein